MYKKLIQGKKAVIFDLDGTIAVTRPFGIKALQQVLDEIEASYINAELYSFSGYPMRTSWKVILEVNELATKKTLDELIERTNEVYKELIRNSDLEPRDGFWDLFYELKQEKGFKTALVTNTERGNAQVVMEKLEINGIFDFELFGDEVKKLKPSPEIYRKIIKKLGLKPAEILVFEDSIPGVTAAVKAKLDVLVLWDGDIPKNEYPGKPLDFFPDFSDLPGKLDETYLEYMKRQLNEAVKSKSAKLI